MLIYLYVNGLKQQHTQHVAYLIVDVTLVIITTNPWFLCIPSVCICARWFSHSLRILTRECKKTTSPIKPERKVQGRSGLLRPQGGHHPQVTRLNITLSLDTERLIEARDRGSCFGSLWVSTTGA